MLEFRFKYTSPLKNFYSLVKLVISSLSERSALACLITKSRPNRLFCYDII